MGEGIRHANRPMDWNDPNSDRDMWFTFDNRNGYGSGYERTFGDKCEECGAHMTPGDDALHCEACGHERKYS